MLVAAALALAMTPTHYAVQQGEVDLETLIPRQFGPWREVKTALVPMDLTPREGEAATMDQPYDQVLQRTYARSDGEIIMLALAYGRVQRQEVKIHRPELCYVAQGFEISHKEQVSLSPYEGRSIQVFRLMTRGQHRVEPVTYWVRIGDEIPRNAWQSRWAILKSGFKGYIPDGILVRVSQALPTADLGAKSYEAQELFLRELLAHMSPGARAVLGGSQLRN